MLLDKSNQLKISEIIQQAQFHNQLLNALHMQLMELENLSNTAFKINNYMKFNITKTQTIQNCKIRPNIVLGGYDTSCNLELP